MADNEELKEGITEAQIPSSEGDQLSTPSEPVSDGSDFTETDVFKKAVQAHADRSMATLQRNVLRQVQEAKAEAAKAKAEAEARAEKASWAGKQQAERQAWMEAGMAQDKIDAFQNRENQLLNAMTSQRQRELEYAPRLERADRYSAADTAISDVLGEDGLDGLTPKQYRDIANAAEGDTLKERVAYAKLKVIELKGTTTVKPDAKPSVRRPDPGVSGATASKGKFFTLEQVNAMSPEEYAKNEPAIMESIRAGRIKPRVNPLITRIPPPDK